MCVDGARWVQREIVERYRNTELKVYVIWMPILPADARKSVSETRIDGPGVRKFWDEERRVGKWIEANVKDCKSLGPIAWDSFYLFDGDAEWADTLGPIEACGAPLIKESAILAAKAKEILEAPDAP